MGRKTAAGARTSRSKATKSPERPCYFLDLPGEIRNRIFRHVLDQHFDQSTTLSLSNDVSDPSVFRPTPQQPPLARTSRQLRHEVLSIFFGERTFEIDREMGVQNLISNWTRIMRPALFYLRSIRFELFSEYTASSKDMENGHCDAITVHAWLTDDNIVDYCVDSDATCECKFARCVRDVETGVLGSPNDAPLIRFLKAWDLPAPPVRGDRYMVCSGCGGGNVQVSLRDIRRRPSL